jgi:inner membrane protein
LHQFEKALDKQGIHYSEIIVKPTAFNIILWNANVATTASYLLADYSQTAKLLLLLATTRTKL